MKLKGQARTLDMMRLFTCMDVVQEQLSDIQKVMNDQLSTKPHKQQSLLASPDF